MSMNKVIAIMCFVAVFSCTGYADVLDDYFSSPKPTPAPVASPEPVAVKPATVEAVAVKPPATSEATKIITLEASVTPEVKAVPVIIKKTVKYPVASSEDMFSYFMNNKKLSKYMKKVMAGRADTGMNSDMLSMIYGEPYRKVEKQLKKNNIEVWVIDNSEKNPEDRSYTIIGLKDDKVVSMDNHSATHDADKTINDLSR